MKIWNGISVNRACCNFDITYLFQTYEPIYLDIVLLLIFSSWDRFAVDGDDYIISQGMYAIHRQSALETAILKFPLRNKNGSVDVCYVSIRGRRVLSTQN